jgi:hypothetical protein
MLIVEKKSKSTMCPLTLSRPQVLGCQGTRCAAFRWTSQEFKDDTLRTALGEPVGYCGMVGLPEYIQETVQFPKPTRHPSPPVCTKDESELI